MLKEAMCIAMELIREGVEQRAGISLGALEGDERTPIRVGIAAAVCEDLDLTDLARRWIEALAAARQASEAGCPSRASG